jgi:DNA-binding response OmpR family regulator
MTAPQRVLIIEDDAELGRLIAARLRSSGYQAHLVPDGMAAIQAALANRPDLVILDLMLPAGGGLNVLKRLRMSVKTNTIPVLILTGVTDEARRQEVMAEGADAYLTKPYEPAVLLAEVGRLLDRTAP